MRKSDSVQSRCNLVCVIQANIDKCKVSAKCDLRFLPHDSRSPRTFLRPPKKKTRRIKPVLQAGVGFTVDKMSLIVGINCRVLCLHCCTMHVTSVNALNKFRCNISSCCFPNLRAYFLLALIVLGP